MRRSIFRAISVAIVLIVVSVAALAQAPIGSIEAMFGFVEIDAFGVGEFVDALAPEAVYEASVVRTDYESWAYITIDGEEHTVGPNSTTPVSTFISEQRRGRSEGFFARILRELARSLSPPEDQILVAGGRAAEIQGPTTSWVFEIDPNELFEEALHQIGAGRFESAVESLRLIEFPEDGDYEIEEYYVNLVYALMGMGDFYAAMSAGFEYALVEPDPDYVNLLTDRLQLLGGIAAYYAGEDQIAAVSLDAYLDDQPLASAAAEAISVKYSLLRDTDRNAEAASLLRDARRAQPGVDWDAVTNR
ncbi:MAG: hypothetical protein V3S41_06230 [Spirochaetia bacterium]